MPGNRLQAMVPRAVDAGNRFEQSPGVRIQRILEKLGGRRLLHHARGVKDRHVIGILGDDSEIVRDQDHREPEARLQARESGRESAPGW